MVCEAICDRLTEAGCEVVATADNGASAVEASLSTRPDVILMDVRLKGDIDGIHASELINEKVRTPVVYLTGDSDRTTLQRAKAASAYGYVLKPFHIKNLIVAIEVAVERFEMERRLEDSQLTYATILSSIGDAVIAVDMQGSIRFMNAIAERLTGWSTREAELKPLEIALNLMDAGEMVVDLLGRVLRSRSTLALGSGAVVISRHGVQVPVDGSMSCVIDGLGRAVGAAITLRDVTSARKAESDLGSLARQLRTVIDTAVDGVLMLDAAGTILMINSACERLFGYTAAEMIGRNVETIMPSPPTGGRDTAVDASSGRLLVAARATTCRRRDRSAFPAEVSVGEADHPADRRFVCVVHDVSERRDLEAALLDVVSREQRRFASDLHDGLGQELTGLSLLLSALGKAAAAAGSPHAADLVRAGEVARHALHSSQTIARGLSPIGSTEGGLVGALRQLVCRLQGSSGPHLDISVSEVSRLGLSPSTTDHLYRIAQEALSNALKHANAKSIEVSLDVQREHVRLEVRDDGEGVREGARGAGLGLRTMQYRASMIGARFEIAPNRPRGTCVICDCPQTHARAASAC